MKTGKCGVRFSWEGPALVCTALRPGMRSSMICGLKVVCPRVVVACARGARLRALSGPGSRRATSQPRWGSAVRKIYIPLPRNMTTFPKRRKKGETTHGSAELYKESAHAWFDSRRWRSMHRDAWHRWTSVSERVYPDTENHEAGRALNHVFDIC
jgi:hypothetical protein